MKQVPEWFNMRHATLLVLAMLFSGCFQAPDPQPQAPIATFGQSVQDCEGHESWMPLDPLSFSGELPDGYEATLSLEDQDPFLGLAPVPYAGRVRILAIECSMTVNGTAGATTYEGVRLAFTSILLAASQGPMRGPKPIYSTTYDHDEFVFEAFVDAPSPVLDLWRQRGWPVEPASIAIDDNGFTIKAGLASYEVAVGANAQEVDNNIYSGERFHGFRDGMPVWWDIDGGRVDRYGPQRDCQVKEATGRLQAMVRVQTPWPCLDPMFTAEGNVVFSSVVLS